LVESIEGRGELLDEDRQSVYGGGNDLLGSGFEYRQIGSELSEFCEAVFGDGRKQLDNRSIKDKCRDRLQPGHSVFSEYSHAGEVEKDGIRDACDWTRGDAIGHEVQAVTDLFPPD
jgi:hypothetical protein